MKSRLTAKPTMLTPIDQVPCNGRSSVVEPNRRLLLKLGAASFLAPSLPGKPCFTPNPGRNPALHPSRRITRQPTAALVRIPFPGLTKTAITIRARCRTSNYQTFTTSQESWRAPTDSMARVLIITATASLGGTPTTDYSYMAGEYWAGRQSRQGVFTPHLTDGIQGTGGPCKPDP